MVVGRSQRVSAKVGLMWVAVLLAHALDLADVLVAHVEQGTCHVLHREAGLSREISDVHEVAVLE
jgi:hypothetical protein